MNNSLSYPVDVIAKFLNLTNRRVQQLAKQNVVVKSSRGEYDLLKSIHGYLDYQDSQIPGKAQSGSSTFAAIDLVVEQAKLTKHRAEIERMKEQEMKGLLVEKSAEMQYAFKLARITRNNVLNLPAQLSIILAAESDADKIYRILKNELTAALTEIKSIAEQEEQEEQHPREKWAHDTECYHWHWTS